ncbi:MAG TPA: ABC transporter substrate-binding protein [Gaiella sp.]|jgi:hypothetical protein
MSVHSILPPALTEAVEGVLRDAGTTHVAHGDRDHLAAASAIVRDPEARAVIGPYRSRAVAEVVEVTAPAGVPLLAPVATWSGVTRDDEPGCDDHPARHRGTVLRLVARDTVVAQRIADRVRGGGQRAVVVAGDHDYGTQLDAQLAVAGLPRASATGDADVVVLAGLVGKPELDAARALAPLPILAFDGIQGEAFPGQEVELVLVYAHGPVGVAEARRAAELVSATTDLAELRRLGRFDEHGDPLDPVVRFERYDTDRG